MSPSRDDAAGSDWKVRAQRRQVRLSGKRGAAGPMAAAQPPAGCAATEEEIDEPARRAAQMNADLATAKSQVLLKLV